MYDEDSGGGNVIGKIVLCSGITFCALAVVFFLFVRKNPEAVAAPATYTKYVASDKAFACAAPDGWKRAESGGGGIMSGVDFTKGAAKVDIISDLQGSLMADLSRGPVMTELTPGMKLTPGLAAQMKEAARPPVEKLHISREGHVGDAVKDYKEMPMRTITSGIGEGRCSEWSGDAGFLGGGKMHGYRATLLSGERRVTVVCRCPETNWKTLQPAFDKMLASLTSGGG